VKNAFRDWGIFALVQVLVCLAVYGSALWGARFLAPLDIAPAIFPAYKFVDPTSNGIPDNHYIIDQLTYDLPLQTVIYDAYRRGEIPWWDPYTYGGRPLLADAHINGTDPIRVLCYLTLPFELAYNWNLVLHSLVAAAGMFALLSFWRFGLFTCTTMAIAWQFSGAFIMHFGHPWIVGTFAWFPFIWICWQQAVAPGSPSVRNTAFAALLCGASFYSGNLQSHLYLPVFALAFLIGHWSTNLRATARIAGILAASGILGAALAAPVLANQIEFFLLSTREVATTLEWWQHPFKVLLSLGGVFPWVTGTFRTLDIGKVVRSSGTAWLLFCGSVTFVLAVFGLFSLRAIAKSLRPLWRTSVGLIVAYLIIAGTPLTDVFYLRVAPLAVLGIVALGAIGLDRLSSVVWTPRPKFALMAGVCVLLITAAINAGALLLYPAVKNELTQAALSADSSSRVFPPGASALRNFQVENFPAEVSLLNPETVSSFVALLMLSAALGSRSQILRRRFSYTAVAVSLCSLLIFAGRFIPNHPVEMLDRLRAGGPAQKEAIDLVIGSNGRILERDMQVFPYAMAALYRVHTVHGYSALQPPGIFRRPEGDALPEEFGADFDIQLSGSTGLIVQRASEKPPEARFSTPNGVSVEIANQTLNQISLTYSDGLPSAIFRSDTYYPGWRFASDEEFSATPYKLGSMIKPIRGVFPKNLQILYRPSLLLPASFLAALASIIVAAMATTPQKLIALHLGAVDRRW
jgi:hypothetical protein